MRIPTHDFAYQVLLLQAADEGRGPVLFGESLERARTAVPPFMVGEGFPSVYFEFPLAGSPFLDVTLLYGRLPKGTRIDSPALTDAEALLSWAAYVDPDVTDFCFGFELDTKEAELPEAAVHFQPRERTELVAPFCEAVGEPERAALYLGQKARMPKGWPLAFFGMFRGRVGSPLRVCGYLARDEKNACANSPERLAQAFDEVGFTAYDDAVLAQATELLGIAPGAVDFQFDVYPDGHLGPTFAFDVQFGIEQPEDVRASFESGSVADVMDTLEAWGAADGRWHLAADAAFARALPVELEDGTLGRYAFTLMPQWTKARWSNGVLQPSKLYLLAHAAVV